MTVPVAPVCTNGSPGNRPVNSSGSASHGRAGTVWNTHAPSLDPSKTLPDLKITQPPAADLPPSAVRVCPWPRVRPSRGA